MTRGKKSGQHEMPYSHHPYMGHPQPPPQLPFMGHPLGHPQLQLHMMQPAAAPYQMAWQPMQLAPQHQPAPQLHPQLHQLQQQVSHIPGGGGYMYPHQQLQQPLPDAFHPHQLYSGHLQPPPQLPFMGHPQLHMMQPAAGQYRMAWQPMQLAPQQLPVPQLQQLLGLPSTGGATYSAGPCAAPAAAASEAGAPAAPQQPAAPQLQHLLEPLLKFLSSGGAGACTTGSGAATAQGEGVANTRPRRKAACYARAAQELHEVVEEVVDQELHEEVEEVVDQELHNAGPSDAAHSPSDANTK